MLKISHISKTFNPGTVNEKKAITDLSLELKKGDFATIIGSNGAGKSTLFNAICGDFKRNRPSLSGPDARNCSGYDDRRESCACSREGRMAFPHNPAGKRTFSLGTEETGHRPGRADESSGRTSFRWAETGLDTSDGDHEPAETASSG